MSRAVCLQERSALIAHWSAIAVVALVRLSRVVLEAMAVDYHLNRPLLIVKECLCYLMLQDLFLLVRFAVPYQSWLSMGLLPLVVA